jgi:hypothetical protein
MVNHTGHSPGRVDVIDKELVDLLVDEYTLVARELYPDLASTLTGSVDVEPSDGDMRDALTDCMADRICDAERMRGGAFQYEFRVAAEAIAIHFCGT